MVDTLEDLAAAALARRTANVAAEPAVRQLHLNLVEHYRRRSSGGARRRVRLLVATGRRLRLSIAVGAADGRPSRERGR